MLIHQHEQQQTQQKKLETEQMDPDVHKLSEENRNLIQKLEESKKEILSLESANADLKGQINYNQFNRGTPQMGLSCTSTTTPSSMSSDASYVHVEVPDVEVNAVTESKIESVNDPPTEREIHSPEISSSSSSSSKTTSSSAVEVIHVEEVEEPSRMKLQQSFKNDQKFHDAMKKIADLMNEKDYLEHIVVQLQEETETVGEYITLYQYQRSMQKKNLEDKEKQLQKVCRDREELMSKLEELQKLLTHFVEDKDDNDKENKVPIVNRPKIPSGSLQEEFNNERSIDQNTNIPHVHSVPSSYVVENEDNTIESKETANKILSLLNEIGTNKALNDEFRPWFWDKSISRVLDALDSGKRKPTLARYTVREKDYRDCRDLKPIPVEQHQSVGLGNGVVGGVVGPVGNGCGLVHGGGSNGSQLKQTFMSDPQNRQQVVNHLSNLPENVKLMILNNYRDFMSNRHLYLTHEQIAEIDRAINRARTSRRRAEMSQEERAVMNQSKREYMSRYRAKMTQEKKSLLKVNNRERMSTYRADMTGTERDAVKSANRNYMSQVRSDLSQKDRDKASSDKRVQEYRAYMMQQSRDDKFWCWPHQYS
ncbi:GOLGA2 [Lepeophtheirus salmonis]|uniref:GOLGA2 n=1 Tax=Lepeophtheirus salmonis TaxID=72036 RepID=A0A7R8CDT3_LEPSM|nr:GOLGA2 [Lepeophtheirus salmonis]CAF2783788.1 GOLGA2 [Lepeophtheirus salmonis]